jgi:hypothetical protein
MPRPRALRYLVAMKKTHRELVLRRETSERWPPRNSHAPSEVDSADARCLAAAITDTHDAACPTTVAVI